MKIWITRETGSSIQYGGLDRINVWFFEPCLRVQLLDDYFSEEYDKIHSDLQGILYGRNVEYNFLYRSENNRESSFGNKLIRNHDGVDFPERLVELEKQNKIKFYHEVFGSGRKVHYRPNKASLLFGFPDETKAPDVSKLIWQIVCDEFENKPFNDWDNLEDEKPWWKFCKELEIEIKLHAKN